VTNVEGPPVQVVKAYRQRMQIEEMFRDTKSYRYGWSFVESRSTSLKRIEVMLCIAAIAQVVVYLAALNAEHHKRHLQYQANSTKNRRVLSLFTLGNIVIHHKASKTHWLLMLRQLRQMIPQLQIGEIT
jgi:hypothetical protein